MADKFVKVRANNEITSREVRLIGDNVLNGVYKLSEALGKADSMGLDLIEVGAGDIPVCRLGDYCKFVYDMKKKKKEMQASQKDNKQKEVQFSQNIDDHDYEFKRNNARNFLEKGNSVRVVLSMRGREMQYVDKSKELLTRLIGELSDCSTCEETLRPEGNKIIINLRPKKKK